MNLYTIGFTRKSAETFFKRLKRAGVKRLIDVRLNNVSQLAGFAKRDDLRYFTRAICDADYVHVLELAPTQAMLDDYRRQKGDWTAYERAFRGLLAERRIERTLAPELFDHACLLCSEDKPQHCHRRVVADYLNEHWGDVTIEHL
jgi:uncharacterized protein (DUF488 family)